MSVQNKRYEAMLAQLEDLADLAAIKATADEPARDYTDFLAEMCREDCNPPPTADQKTQSSAQ